jgi:hypothetical protein
MQVTAFRTREQEHKKGPVESNLKICGNMCPCLNMVVRKVHLFQGRHCQIGRRQRPRKGLLCQEELLQVWDERRPVQDIPNVACTQTPLPHPCSYQFLWFISKRKRRSLLAHWHCMDAGGGIAHRLRCWYVITPRQASKACLRRSIRKNLSERCLQLRAHLHHIITRLFQREC